MIINLFLYVLICTQLFFIQADSCCRNSCLNFKDKTRYLCALRANEIQSLGSGYINNASFNNLTVINDNTTNGDLVAANISVIGDVNVVGDITVDGVSITTNTVSQYGLFISTVSQVVSNLDIVELETVTANGITNAAGVITFSEPGYYIANYTIAIQPAGQSTFRLVFDPLGAATLIPGAQFNTVGGSDDYQQSGITIIQIPSAGTTIGLQNFTGGARQIDAVAGLPNNIASLQIVKIADL